MDAVSESNYKKITYIFTFLIIIELFGSAMGIINVLYYDYNTQSFTGIFKNNLVRFFLRELIVYINAAIGYYVISKKLINQQMAKTFLLTTIILDLLFITSGVLRQLGFDNVSILTAYSNIYNIIGSGMLFLFFSGITFIQK